MPVQHNKGKNPVPRTVTSVQHRDLLHATARMPQDSQPPQNNACDTAIPVLVMIIVHGLTHTCAQHPSIQTPNNLMSVCARVMSHHCGTHAQRPHCQQVLICVNYSYISRDQVCRGCLQRLHPTSIGIIRAELQRLMTLVLPVRKGSAWATRLPGSCCSLD
jgi:hypothetical protein